MKQMQKKIVFITLVFVSLYGLRLYSSSNITALESDNPYGMIMKVGMLPKEDADKKIVILEKASRLTKSLVPKLLLIQSLYELSEQKKNSTAELQKIVTLINSIKELKELILQNPKIGLIAVKTYIRLQQNNEALNLLANINGKHPTNQEVAFLLAQLYENLNQLENALRIIKNYLNKSLKQPSNVAFLVIESRIHLKLNNNEKALKSIEEALSLHPYFDMGWLIFAQLQEKKGELGQAAKGYTNYLELSSGKQKNALGQVLFKAIEQKLMQIILILSKEKNPQQETDQISKSQNKIKEMFQQGKYKDALDELDRITSGSKNEEKRLLKVEFLGAMDKHEEAANLVKEWIIENPKNSLWFETLHLLYFSGLDSRIAIKTLLEIDKQIPNNLLSSLYLADMFTRIASFKQAIAYHHKALKLTNDLELQTSILFQLGILYYETKQFNKMEIVLKKGKSLGLDYAPLLNLLAYYYTHKEENLPKAQTLIKTVLKIEPHNSHFIDTQALIFYKQKKYKKALGLLEKISKQEPSDSTIIKHLAKTYEKLGKIPEAIACMNRVATLTYEKQKKVKYQQLANHWKSKSDEKGKNNLLCGR